MKKNNDALIWLEYCRKSSEQEDKQTLSIDAQKREIADVAVNKYAIKISHNFSESQSAYKTGRDEFNKMVTLIEEGTANAIIVYHLSRLARNTFDGGRLIYLMDEGKLQAIATPTRIYTNTPDDKFFLQLEFGMSKKSSDDTSMYVLRDIRSKLLKGEVPMMAPIGYLNLDKNGRIAGKLFDSKKQIMLESLGRPLKRIEQDPIVAPLIRQLFDEALKGEKNMRELCEFSTELGIFSQRFKKKINKSQLQRIFTNPFFTGVILSQGEIYPGVHESIISSYELERIQNLLSGRSRPRPKTHTFAFSGLVRCGVCGMSIIGTNKVKKSGRTYNYYMCSKRQGNCGQLGMKAEELERQIEEKLQSIRISERLWRVSVKLIRESYGSQIGKEEVRKEKWNAELHQTELKIKRLLDMRLDGSVNDEDYRSKKIELRADKDRLMALINDAGQNNNNWIKRAEEFFETAHTVYDIFRNGDLQAKKRVARLVGGNSVLKDGILTWVYNNPFSFLVDHVEEAELELLSVGTLEFGFVDNEKVSPFGETTSWRTGRGSNP